MHEYFKHSDQSYSDIALYIPDVMNALFNEKASDKLHKWEIRNAFRVKMMQSKAWLISRFKDQNLPKSSNI